MRLIVMASVLFFSLSAFSQNAFDSKAGWSYYSDGLGGTRVISGSRVIGSFPAPVSPYVGGLPAINGTSLSTLASGEISLAAKTSAQIGGKLSVLDVVAKIPKRDVVGALGRFVAKLSYPLSVGMGLWDLGKELGFDFDNSGGVLTVSKPAGWIGGFTPAQIANCQNGGNVCHARERGPGEAGCYSSFTSSGGRVILSQDGNPNYAYAYYCPSSSQPAVPSTVKEFQDAIEAKSSWSPTSAYGRAFRDAVASGESVPVDTPTLTGPASVTGTPTVSTTHNPNSTGSTTGPGSSTTTITNTPTTNITYQGDKYTTSTTNNISTTTTTVNNDNSVTSSTSTTTVDKPEEPDDGTVSDTPLADIPKLYTPKYADGLTGVWDQKIQEIKSLPLFNAAANLMPNVASGGTCPHWFINLNLDPRMNYGSHDVAPPCWVWDFGKFIIVISALLLARRLVFGG